MESDIHYDVEDSPRVSTLIQELKKHKSEQARILIFVKCRATAERLCRRLKDEPDISGMNPAYIIGKSNNGMSMEMQQTVLQNFHDGKCQVLVATSLLEQ